MASTTFTAKYNVGDPGFIFVENNAVAASVTNISFRAGCNFNAFVPGTDFIYTTNHLSAAGDGTTFLETPENLFFATKSDMQTYIGGVS